MISLSKFSDLAGRILLASVFLVAGINKLTGFTGTQDYMESVGVPGLVLPAIIMLEIVGALMLVSGWYVRLAALALALFSLATAFIFHFNLGNQIQQFMFMKNIAIAGGLLLLVNWQRGAS